MKKWKQFEHYIAEKLRKIDTDCRPTKASGGSTEIGDIYSKYLMVECKQRNTKNVTINIATWEKNKADLPANSKRIPILALENKDQKRFIVLEADDFFDILYQAYKE